MGVAAHFAIADLIRQGVTTTGRIAQIAQTFAVDPNELHFCFSAASRMWSALKPHFPGTPHVESEVSSSSLSIALGEPVVGHPDFYSVFMEKRRGFGIDWKFGHKASETDYRPQVAGYAYCVAEEHNLDDVWWTIANVRDETWRTFHYKRAELEAWGKRLAAQAQEKEKYRPGSHCGYCPRFVNCDGRARVVHAFATEFLPALSQDAILEDTIRSISNPEDTPERRSAATHVADLIVAARLAEKVASTLVEHLGLIVSKGSGSIATADGRSIAAVASDLKRIDPVAAMPIVRELIANKTLTHEQVDACVQLSRAKIEDAYAGAFPRDKKKAAREWINKAFESAGAVSVTSSVRLTVSADKKEGHNGT